MRHTCWVAALLVGATHSPLRGQGLRIAGPPRENLLLVSRVRQDSVPRAIVHGWQEPALVGGAVLGSLTQLAVFGLCTGSDTSDDSQCVLPAEAGFLFGGAFGGLTAALIGSSSGPATPPKGREFHGDRRVEGALMLALPSLAVNVLAIRWYCRRDSYRPSGCTAGNVITALLSSGINALIGSALGKGVPGLRDVRE